MKLNLGDTQLVIGKRVAVGTAINSTAATIAYFFPDYAPAIISAAVPITFLVQIFIVNRYGVTR